MEDPKTNDRAANDRAAIDLAVILAGGAGTRLGRGDKALVPFRGVPLITRVADRLRAQAARLAINANGDESRFAFLDCAVIGDSAAACAEGGWGPAGGVAAALGYAERAYGSAAWVLVAPVDAPFVPLDLGNRLRAAAEAAGADVAYVRSDGRDHPTFGLWRASLGPRVEALVAGEGVRAMMALMDRLGALAVEFDAALPDPFANINTPADFAAAEAAAVAAD